MKEDANNVISDQLKDRCIEMKREDSGDYEEVKVQQKSNIAEISTEALA